jgi:polyisoprenyl-teichoic acid--peptidoglycan teichoic acid transferase
MGRQRCLLQNILTQKSPTDLLANFQGIAAATTNSVNTNIPKDILPALTTLAGNVSLESVSFDPNLPDPSEDDGRFNTGDPNFSLMRQVVQDAITRPAAPPPPAGAAPSSAAPTTRPDADDEDEDEDEGNVREAQQENQQDDEASAAPTSLAQSCS